MNNLVADSAPPIFNETPQGGNPVAPIDSSSITTFVDDATSNETTLVLPLSGVTGLSVAPVLDQGIKSFLERPQYISTVAWASGSAAGTDLYTAASSTYLSNDVFASKLKGFGLFRGTLCIKVILNAQPFQQGRVFLRVLPFASAQVASYGYAHNYDLVTKTQQPHVDLDCRDSSATLKIPWVGPNPWFDIKTPLIDWGTIYITVLVPLGTGTSGSTAASISTFVYFENPEFSVPIVPQGLYDSVTYSGDWPSNDSNLVSYTAALEPQGRRAKKKFATEQEASASSGGGPISDVLNTVSSIATCFQDVPIIGEFAEPLSWVSDIASGILSIFGWSKPLLSTEPEFVVLRPYHNNGNSAGTSTAEPLSVYPAPGVNVLPGFAGSNVDEMAFAYVLRVPAYDQTITWALTDAVGTNLLSDQVGPYAYRTPYTVGTTPSAVSFETMPPFSYVSRMFRLWRGSVKLHLKIIKTEYHSGRLQVTYTPFPTGISATPTLATASYCLRAAIDIREANEFELVMPYMLSTCYQNQQLYMGNLDLIVLNALQAPDTVKSSISIVTFFSAGDDFELAFPDNVTSAPFTPQSFQVFPQGKSSLGDTVALDTIGGQNPLLDNAAEYCIGEKVLSIKQLISRHSRLFFTTSVDAQVGMRFYPWGIGVNNGQNAGTYTSGWMMGDVYSYLAAGYALARGGMNFTFSPSSSTLSTLSYSVTPLPGTTPAFALGGTSVPSTLINGPNVTSSTFVPATSSTTGTGTGSSFCTIIQSTNGVDITIPQYSNNPSRLIPWLTTANSNPSTDYTALTAIAQGTLSWEAKTTHAYKNITRAAAEDAQLGYFIGFPPLYLSKA